ncbi:hypothetical protein OUZ56_012310 [Daphnia magna]|uniref:Uncharacterized protein n=1 Tax=Daphnia magna TaxID=35525 RepID=A0ABQ9Z2T4_9CRUS|nr:hypothetical protein OUZ56_012310 [Daphnia magna]
MANNNLKFLKSSNEIRAEGNKKYFHRKPSHPWKGDPLCEHFVVQLAEWDSLPKWPITSFPGSGVTWTRQLIEGVTGIYTGSVYTGDPSPVLLAGKENDNTDDPLCGCTIIDKDHEATITTLGLASYFELLHRYVMKFLFTSLSSLSSYILRGSSKGV